MTTRCLPLRSLVRDDNTLALSLAEVDFPEPGPGEVLVRVDATPINPSDLFLLVGPADPSTFRAGGTPDRPVLTADIPLTAAIDATGATLAFDATGGGELASQILSCMEAAAVSLRQPLRPGEVPDQAAGTGGVGRYVFAEASAGSCH